MGSRGDGCAHGASWGLNGLTGPQWAYGASIGSRGLNGLTGPQWDREASCGENQDGGAYEASMNSRGFNELMEPLVVRSEHGRANRPVARGLKKQITILVCSIFLLDWGHKGHREQYRTYFKSYSVLLPSFWFKI